MRLGTGLSSFAHSERRSLRALRQAAAAHAFRWVAMASLLSFAVLVLVGCAAAPVQRPPSATLPAQWHAPAPQADGAVLSADWWTTFDDPAVATLVQWASTDSPTLEKALAQINLARATLASSVAALQPSATGGAAVQRGRTTAVNGAPATLTTRSASLDASWEIDLFGRLSAARTAAGARVEARTADWQASRLALAAEVADDYLQYRACRLLESAYAEQVASLEQTLRVTAASVQAGFSAEADADLATASAATARGTRLQQQTTCEVLVKVLAALTGAAEPTLRQTIDARSDADLPRPALFTVTQLPAELLRQRPDIAAAERTLAAASADIDQADADRYPSFSLGGTIAIAAIGGAAALTTSALGPSLSLPIFDGGKRRAVVASAQASYDSALADYKSTLRTAVQEVEQALAQLYGAARRTSDAALSAALYQRYFDAAQVNWRAGGIDLLTLEASRRNQITAETTSISVQLEQLRQLIALYKALGGGWRADAALAAAGSGADRTLIDKQKGSTQ